jgi:hypothetical protein
VPAAIAKELEAVARLSDMLVDAPFATCSASIARTIARMHTEDLTSQNLGEDGCSLYVMDLSAQLSMFVDGVVMKLARTRCLGVLATKMARQILDLFVRHATLVFPLPDVARYRLAADMAHIELAVEALCPVRMLGGSYLAVRSLKQLVLYSDDDLSSAPPTIIKVLAHMRPSHVAYHLFSRCNSTALIHPHRHRNMAPTDFVSWLDEHTEDEAWSEVEDSVRAYAADLQAHPGEQSCAQYAAFEALADPLRRQWLHARSSPV